MKPARNQPFGKGYFWTIGIFVVVMLAIGAHQAMEKDALAGQVYLALLALVFFWSPHWTERK